MSLIYSILSMQLLGVKNAQYIMKSNLWCSELTGRNQYVSLIDVEVICVCVYIWIWTHACFEKTWSGFSYKYTYNCRRLTVILANHVTKNQQSPGYNLLVLCFKYAVLPWFIYTRPVSSAEISYALLMWSGTWYWLKLFTPLQSMAIQNGST